MNYLLQSKKRLLVFIVIAHLFVASAWSQEVPMMSHEASQAILAAQERFKVDEANSDLENYTVRVINLPTAFEVLFIPNLPPLKESSSGEVQVTLGGRTVYGREVHYMVERDTYKIIRRSFAR
jgi:hypothetical protein